MPERIVHYEITADDPERAAAFYRDAFGWVVDKWDGPVDYWLATTGDGPGIDGAIMSRAHNQAVINTLQIEGSLEDAITRVKKAGGEHSFDIQQIPGVGRFTYARDTEGNVLGLMEPEGTG